MTKRNPKQRAKRVMRPRQQAINPERSLVDSSVSDLAKLGKQAAIVQAFKNAYLKKIRHDPVSVLGAVMASDIMTMEGDALLQKEYRNTPLFLVTYNPVAGIEQQNIVTAFAHSFKEHIICYKWVQALSYGVEVAPETLRPHIHMVIHVKKKRFPSEIQAQLWAMARNVYHKKHYSSLVMGPGHNVSHMDVRALTTRKQMTKAVNYIVKGRQDGSLLSEGSFGESPLIWPVEPSEGKATVKVVINDPGVPSPKVSKELE